RRYNGCSPPRRRPPPNCWKPSSSLPGEIMVRPIRRIVAGNDDRGLAVALSDGPSPDVRLDPARSGFAMTRLWVQDSTPARAQGLRETLQLPHTLDPPPRASICRVVEYPPEADYLGKVSESDVRAWFAAMGSPGATTA